MPGPIPIPGPMGRTPIGLIPIGWIPIGRGLITIGFGRIGPGSGPGSPGRGMPGRGNPAPGNPGPGNPEMGDPVPGSVGLGNDGLGKLGPGIRGPDMPPGLEPGKLGEVERIASRILPPLPDPSPNCAFAMHGMIARIQARAAKRIVFFMSVLCMMRDGLLLNRKTPDTK